MQFPDDVLGIIRDYLRPKMQFVNEYQEGRKKVKSYMHAHGMIYLLCDVKRKMFTEEAKQVLDAWIEFTSSVPYTNEMRYTHLLEGPISRERKEEFTRRLTLQDKKEQDLRRVVYGEKRWR